MTHDELLVQLSIPIILKPGIEQADIVNIVLLVKEKQALRAVVELHKPFNVGDEVLCESCCAHVYLTDWPCETIQAIEGQLAVG